ncbi:MAG: SMC-Scp complex subunit ScpB, partial [Acidobacteria bacterium]|nr:SMC-Scp complex subunit ScpB [Acidobacteriota bacterium]
MNDENYQDELKDELEDELEDELPAASDGIELENDEIIQETADLSSPESESETEEEITATREELKPAIEAVLFVAEEPLPFKQLCKLLGNVSEDDVRTALEGL